jgi:hypothetical protein
MRFDASSATQCDARPSGYVHGLTRYQVQITARMMSKTSKQRHITAAYIAITSNHIRGATIYTVTCTQR